MEQRIKEQSLAISDSVIKLRRHFHENPEISFEEFKTAEKIISTLKELNLEIEDNIGGTTAVVAKLKGAKQGATIGLRADIDALPIQELSDIPYKSKIDGVMHACGHDTHAACLLGAAMVLSKVKDQLEGDVVFIFEPAEEINRGADVLLKEKVMERYKIDMIFGVHCHPDIPAGKIGVKEGYMMAAVDTTAIKITGKGGHGGIPHNNIDPVVAAASMIMNIQTIVSRNVSAQNPAVVTFGTIHGGTANNVTPDFVELKGTVRTYDDETRSIVEKRLREIVKSSAEALGCTGEFSLKREFSAVNNDPFAASIVHNAAEKIGGAGTVVIPTPSTGGEDFAKLLDKAPGSFLWVGVGNPAIGAIHQWHSPLFVADDSYLWLGAGTMAQAAVDAMIALNNKKA